MAAERAQVPLERIGTIIEKESLRTLKEAGCVAGEPIMAEKCGRGAQGNVELTTNIYGLQMKQCQVYRYDVKISGLVNIRDGKQIEIEFSKRSASDFICADRRAHCRDALAAFEAQFRHVIGNAECLYYDLQSVLYATGPLRLSQERFAMPPPPDYANFKRYHELVFVITAEKALRLGDFSKVTSNLRLGDRDLEQFLDIATGQWPSNHPEEHVTFSNSLSYMMDPAQYYFKADDSCNFPEVDGYLGIGAQKAVRVIEGPRGGSSGKSASIVVETKKTPFHSANLPLSNKIKAIATAARTTPTAYVKKLSEHLKGLYIFTTHTKLKQDIQVQKIVETTAVTQTFEHDGQKISVQDYFRKQYQITLKEPNLPLVASYGKDKKTLMYLPSELCFVHDNQRIKTNQMPGSVTATQIKKCAIPPGTLREQNAKTASSLHFWQGNKWLESAQITIARDPIAVKGQELEPPQLMAGRNDQPRIQLERGCTFQAKSFYAGGHIPKNMVWVAYAFVEDRRDSIPFKDFEKFLQWFVQSANQRGLPLSDPADYQVFENANQKLMEQKMKIAYDNNAYFALCFHNDTSDMHHHIKLVERRMEITTQCVRITVFRNVIGKNQGQTMDNILNKTNVKLGGINIVLRATPKDMGRETPLDPQTLYIGLSSNHPGGGIGRLRGEEGPANPNPVPAEFSDSADEAPSVVGYSANYGTNSPIEFMGDFVYQPPRREEKVDIIQTIVERCLQRFYESHNNTYPNNVMVLRNGVSDGNFPKVLIYEVPLLRESIRKLTKSDIPLTLIVSNKISQNVRFFKKNINNMDKGPEQNIRPGTVIDSEVVHPLFAEFFVNSHKTLQGTAKTPKYSVLYDDNKFPLVRLERVCYELCYGYQIVFFPVSLPAPVYIADQYAKRGRNLYKFHMVHPDARPDESTTYARLSETLGFNTSEFLRTRRVNA